MFGDVGSFFRPSWSLLELFLSQEEIVLGLCWCAGLMLGLGLYGPNSCYESLSWTTRLNIDGSEFSVNSFSLPSIQFEHLPNFFHPKYFWKCRKKLSWFSANFSLLSILILFRTLRSTVPLLKLGFDPIGSCLGPILGLCSPSWPHRTLFWAYLGPMLALCWAYVGPCSEKNQI